MINGISGGNGIMVNNSYSSVPYINNNSNNPMQGMLRLYQSSLQVFDGTSWISFGGAIPTVELNGATQAAINWVQVKMAEESEWRRLAEKHPSVKAALDEANESFDKVRVIATLCKEEDAQVR